MAKPVLGASTLRRGTGGQVMMLIVILALFVSLTLVTGMGVTIVRQAQGAREMVISKDAYFLADSLSEDILYRFKRGKSVASTETLTLAGNTATATILTSGAIREVYITGTKNADVRRIYNKLSQASGTSFFYGVQVGAGGLQMSNSSSIAGNVYSNGPVTGSGNLIQGTVTSASAAGLITSVHATGTAYAHTIQSSTIDGDAYYQVISGTTVGGTAHPGSADQATTTLPIADSTVSSWESAAAAGGVISSPCPYTISSNVTIGRTEIACDVSISGSATVTLTGPIWITGNLSISNSATIQVDPSLGSDSVAIIADNPSDHLASSEITISNSTTFLGSGTPGSYVLLLSQNNAAEQGKSDPAITISNSAHGSVILYAGHGNIQISNSVMMREVTAYKISTSNSATIIYQTGLQNLLFNSGPGGSYAINRWLEVP